MTQKVTVTQVSNSVAVSNTCRFMSSGTSMAAASSTQNGNTNSAICGDPPADMSSAICRVRPRI